ncbi:MAG: two-component sensor histidine kinase [Actinobacteria bacterium]|nr:two-component sensor histidine kinase [Actinomycetota bacterium]
MDLGRSVVEPFRRHPAVGSALLGLVLIAAFVVIPVLAPVAMAGHGDFDLELTAPDVALTVVSGLILTQLRRWPEACLVLTTVAGLVSIFGGWQVNLAPLAVTIAIFGYALRRPRRSAVKAAVVTSLVLGGAAVGAGLWRGEWGRESLVLWLWTATAVAIAAQSRRAAMDDLEDRARRAEESREETARRRVAEDRVRIARELHDVIAHHVAVISVQSGVADHLIERDPESAHAALHHVRTSARSVLTELQSVLGVLRQDESALPTAPAPGLSGLDGLVASFRSIGAQIEVHVPVPMPALARAADVAASRLVQEAMTNVQKHAAGALTTITIRTCDDDAEIAVTNGAPPRPSAAERSSEAEGWAGSGLGLIGMRERVLAAGGTLETGPTPDGGFRVAARLPLDREDR